ncbi:glycosyltransferase [Streptomyces sp. TLI_171]|uniref:glycosyltransferase n=1 Tax=Streptomyces sp. TLI_171 TaxID=1938859 RepID=UPI000C193E53|nr:glycosyltransferase [Streptomyces sp. TLI_171]RKE22084.1 glycosyltransferase involved in cell wall biosynthesis [Streptomyces sp. TLI_171]
MTPSAVPPPGGVPAVGFVMPYYDDGTPWRRAALCRTLDSLRAQTDPNWHLYLTDDHSPAAGTAALLAELAAGLPDRMTVLHAPVNGGAGQARNLAITAAAAAGVPLLAFLDADDLAHPDRVGRVRSAFDSDPALDLAYLDIAFVDEHGADWQEDELLPTLREISRQQALPPLRGREHWRAQAVDRDCLAIPSALNLRTPLAVAHPFPRTPFCEDVATLFRYLGSGARIDRIEGAPTSYRVPRTGGSASRAQAGDLAEFNRLRCVNERAGLEDALADARARGAVTADDARDVLCRYLIRIGRTVAADGCVELGLAQLADAQALAPWTFAAFATPAERAVLRQPLGRADEH